MEKLKSAYSVVIMLFDTMMHPAKFIPYGFLEFFCAI